MKRESWASRSGFIFAAIGSAVGLANIVRFPHLVGQHGGAAFVLVYIASLFVVGIPVFFSEVLLGRRARSNPYGTFKKLGRSKLWSSAGKLPVFTAFFVSAFYCALAGWILGYLGEALVGTLGDLHSTEAAAALFAQRSGSATWCLVWHGTFALGCTGVLLLGLRNGIERGCKWMLPLMVILLLALVVRGLTLPSALPALEYLFAPKWEELTAAGVLMALGQSFFTLSIGQGTMITYGSYLKKGESLFKTCVTVALADTLISLLAAIGVYTVVFSSGHSPEGGLGLIFQTIPVVLNSLPFGWLIAIIFFVLVTLAAVTSEISAMEPVVAYLVDEWKWSRRKAVLATGAGIFAVGVPCALSTNLLGQVSAWGQNILELSDAFATGLLIPIGALLGILLLGWGQRRKLQLDATDLGTRTATQTRIVRGYLMTAIRYVGPAIIVVIFLTNVLM